MDVLQQLLLLLDTILEISEHEDGCIVLVDDLDLPLGDLGRLLSSTSARPITTEIAPPCLMISAISQTG